MEFSLCGGRMGKMILEYIQRYICLRMAKNIKEGQWGRACIDARTMHTPTVIRLWYRNQQIDQENRIYNTESYLGIYEILILDWGSNNWPTFSLVREKSLLINDARSIGCPFGRKQKVNSHIKLHRKISVTCMKI